MRVRGSIPLAREDSWGHGEPSLCKKPRYGRGRFQPVLVPLVPRAQCIPPGARRLASAEVRGKVCNSMATSSHRAAIRLLTVLLLLWVGFDVGAHGLLASDFGPLTEGACAARIGSGDGASAAHGSPGHCFCNGVSIGAVLPDIVVQLAPSGAVLRPLSAQAPRSDGSPLDHPPQLPA